MHSLILLATLSFASVLAFWGKIPAPIQAFLAATFCALVVKYAPKIPGPTQRFFAWLHALIAHVGSPVVRSLLTRVSDAALQAVLWGEQTLIYAIQARVVDGTLPPAQLPAALADAKQQVVARAKSYLSAQGILSLIILIVFGGDGSAFDLHLADRVEAHVGTLPPSGISAAVEAKANPPKPSAK